MRISDWSSDVCSSDLSTAYSLASAGQSGVGGVASGLGGAAKAAGSAAISPLKRAASKATESVKSSFSDGAKSAFETTGGPSHMGTDRKSVVSGKSGSVSVDYGGRGILKKQTKI